MKYADKRAEGIALLRQHAREAAVEKGVGPAYHDLRTAMQALLEEFRCEFDVPGTRYWEHPESNSFFSMDAGENITPMVEMECVELARHEFLSRQDLQFGYEDRV